MLDFWNIVSDLATSVHESFYGDKNENNINRIYDKLFWGNNLPGVTPKRMKRDTKWLDREIHIIANIIRDGLRIIDSHIIQRSVILQK